MLEDLQVDSVVPHPERPYEWVIATATFAVDPQASANRRIVDLELGPSDNGVVRFNSDVRLLRPLRNGAGKALVVVPNRGLMGGLPFSFDTPLFQDQSEPPAAGDGFLLDRGWTIAWCGWQWDVQRDQGWLGLEAPTAKVEPGWMRVEFRPDVDQADHALSDSSIFFRFTEYPTADPDDPDAVLTVRSSPMGPKQVVPRHNWRFVDSTAVALDGGFRAFHWYELIYRSAYAPVVGTGLLALRDFGAFLRHDHGHVFAYGVSQCGRVLRHLLYEGLNVDENGQQVFDAMFSHVASARRGEFNMRYGQPGLTHPMTPAYGPPYDSASLLERQRAIGGVPKVMFTNTSWEYWRGDGALVHQDAETGADLPEDPDARVHMLTGADHYGDVFIKDTMPVANPVHHLEVKPILRALFAQLDAWVCDGLEPEPSCVPALLTTRLPPGRKCSARSTMAPSPTQTTCRGPLRSIQRLPAGRWRWATRWSPSCQRWTSTETRSPGYASLPLPFRSSLTRDGTRASPSKVFPTCCWSSWEAGCRSSQDLSYLTAPRTKPTPDRLQGRS